jgi:hypothetical protein
MPESSLAKTPLDAVCGAICHELGHIAGCGGYVSDAGNGRNHHLRCYQLQAIIADLDGGFGVGFGPLTMVRNTTKRPWSMTDKDPVPFSTDFEWLTLALSSAGVVARRLRIPNMRHPRA